MVIINRIISGKMLWSSQLFSLQHIGSLTWMKHRISIIPNKRKGDMGENERSQ
ncbi:hypothetical protein EDD72_11111 [Tepidibacillus fermentans]|uniref:Uncharacterized protein n=1 Tax=Tepidibacillus fermentans TaxID=1281767 RepID=A0A4R3KEK8_9BACI|nr:hypothetical protein EDD72_11111 [Tepidibacillus fermentans]